jgi:hypothetical protein
MGKRQARATLGLLTQCGYCPSGGALYAYESGDGAWSLAEQDASHHTPYTGSSDRDDWARDTPRMSADSGDVERPVAAAKRNASHARRYNDAA